MSFLVVLLVIAIVLVAGGIVWGIVALVRRQRYISSIRQRGWTFVNTPTWESVGRLSNPPFGVGFHRYPNDQITGTTPSGRPFQVIEYRTTYWHGWVGMVTLTRRLPELWVAGGETWLRYGIRAYAMTAPPQLGHGWRVGALDPAYAHDVLTSRFCQQLIALAFAQPGVNLSIDGDQLVVLDPPRKNLEQLGHWLGYLDAIAAAIDETPLDRWMQPEPPARLTFYHHPDWYWIGRDDSLLHLAPANRGGSGHRTADVIWGRDADGPPFVAFRHPWDTSDRRASESEQGWGDRVRECGVQQAVCGLRTGSEVCLRHDPPAADGVPDGDSGHAVPDRAGLGLVHAGGAQSVRDRALLGVPAGISRAGAAVRVAESRVGGQSVPSRGQLGNAVPVGVVGFERVESTNRRHLRCQW